MPATGTETIPTTWDDTRDNAFFRITAQVFTPGFTYGAGALLASYDEIGAAVTNALVSETFGRAHPLPCGVTDRSPLTR